MDRYNHAEVQKYWQYVWDRDDVYSLPDDAEDPVLVLGMFPYTSGSLHMGHVRNYTITDAYARFRRLRGAKVLHPMGWDAFGLPAENAAYERYTDPESWTRSCISRMRDEMRSLGFGFDWSREITTCDPDYYRWNQWIFTRLHEEGLVEYRGATVNWCPDCETSLAEAQVERREEDQICWRCGTPVTQRELDQWFLTITDYAEELEAGLASLGQWPENVREIQRNWIGRREGVTVSFTVGSTEIDVFTTRVDTIGGASYLAISPDHELVPKLAKDSDEIAEYLDSITDPLNRQRPGSGVKTPLLAIHPITSDKIPVYIASYVLDDVGTGAVMGVPAHNKRDFEFALNHSLPLPIGVHPPSVPPSAVDPPYTDEGIVVNCGDFSGKNSETARSALLDLDIVSPKVTYRLRDWLISRQRYWGTPIPIVHCDVCGPVTVPDDDLPVLLPEFDQTPGNPLEENQVFVETMCPKCGAPAQRETDTMDTFFDSSWYYLRYLSPEKTDGPFDPDLVNEWLPIDVYVGGEEHAILHLLYIRFFIRALSDIGLVDIREPVARLINHGMVLYHEEKMSTRAGNVVGPHEYGAETTRLFLLSAAHPERDFEWTAKDVSSAFDFQQSLYEMVKTFVDEKHEFRSDVSQQDEYIQWITDGTIASVTADYERFRFHNAITAIRDLTRTLRRYRVYGTPNRDVYREGLSAIIRMIAPITPYLGEELWNILRGGGLVVEAEWPAFDANLETFRLERKLVRTTLDDVRDIITMAGITDPESIEIVVAAEWKFTAYTRAMSMNPEEVSVDSIVDEDARRTYGRHASTFGKTIVESHSQLEPIVDPDRELAILRKAKWLFEDEFGVVVTIIRDTEEVALLERAKPNKPAIRID